MVSETICRCKQTCQNLLPIFLTETDKGQQGRCYLHSFLNAFDKVNFKTTKLMYAIFSIWYRNSLNKMILVLLIPEISNCCYK